MCAFVELLSYVVTWCIKKPIWTAFRLVTASKLLNSEIYHRWVIQGQCQSETVIYITLLNVLFKITPMVNSVQQQHKTQKEKWYRNTDSLIIW